jgi:hypothetical protein
VKENGVEDWEIGPANKPMAGIHDNEMTLVGGDSIQERWGRVGGVKKGYMTHESHIGMFIHPKRRCNIQKHDLPHFIPMIQCKTMSDSSSPIVR